MNRFRFCYEQQLSSQPDLGGRVAVQFTISATGAVTQARVAQSTLGNEQCESCIVRMVQRIAFPQPEGGGTVFTLRLPLSRQA